MIDETHLGYFKKYVPSMVERPLIEFGSREDIVDVTSDLKVGVIFCGRQAPGCHDILCGLVDMMKSSANEKVLGFVGGTKGLFEKQRWKSPQRSLRSMPAPVAWKSWGALSIACTRTRSSAVQKTTAQTWV